jgi:hypothetical protein
LTEETLTPADLESMIAYNIRRNIKAGKIWSEYTQIDRGMLFEIPHRMESCCSNIEDRGQRIIKKANQILAGIAFHQPFIDVNKRTAFAGTTKYLRRNGLSIPNKTQSKNNIFRVLCKNVEMYPDFELEYFMEVEGVLSEEVVDYFINDSSSLSNASKRS